MFLYIKGILTEIADDSIVIEAGGIGYLLNVNSRMIYDLPPVGNEVKVYVYFQVREDGVSLFGFSSKREQELFKILITVNSVGPKVALSILSTLGADSIVFAIVSGDVKTISSAPGIGKKTAERIVLELKDKFDTADYIEEKLGQGSTGNASGENSGVKAEAVAALTALGYSAAVATSAIAKIEIEESDTSEDIIKKAFKYLM